MESMEKPGNEPVMPKPASTVILVKEEDNTLKVYLLRRSSGSLFMPGNYVFPGGTLEEEDWDAEFWKTRVDMETQDLEAHLGGDIPAETALAYGVAAIRETFEEAGVFPGKASPVYKALDKMCTLRSAGRLPDIWLREYMADGENLLPISALRLWSRWLTPLRSPVRFDTIFFTAFLDTGAECAPDQRETTHGLWLTPEEGIEGNASGKIPLGPPTLVTLQELLGLSSAQQLLDALDKRDGGDVRMTRQIPVGRGILNILPWDPKYLQEGEIVPERYAPSFLPPGKPFSRLFLDNGIWRPVAA